MNCVQQPWAGVCGMLALVLTTGPHRAQAIDHTFLTKSTLSAAELDHGDSMTVILQDRREIKIELLDSQSRVLFTTLESTRKGVAGGGSIYEMTCRLRVDGQEMSMVRYVPVQQSFYEPYVIGGLRIWFDGLKSVGDWFNETHGECLPKKAARFAFQDATLSISPEPLHNWVPIASRRIDVKDCYAGDDTWMGPYFGADLHGGLDINMPGTTPLWAPIDLDDHYYFNSRAKGDNNNRWRGVRNWDNGDIWHLQTHHMVDLLVPEHQPMRRGQLYSYSGAVRAGITTHSHFIFKLKHPDGEWCDLDAWILFWQTFQQNSERSGEIRAHIAPVAKASTGEKIVFRSDGSRAGVWGSGKLDFWWEFGDGHTSRSENPIHRFSRCGVYPVTLTVSDGTDRDVFTQHVVVSGEDRPLKRLAFSYQVKDVSGTHTFATRPASKSRAYGDPVSIGNSIGFYNAPFTEKSLIATPKNFSWAAGGNLPQIDVEYVHGNDWLTITPVIDQDRLEIKILPKINKMVSRRSVWEAYLMIDHEDAIDGPQEVRVFVDFTNDPPATRVVVDESDPSSEMSDFFWTAPEFRAPWSRGHLGKFYVQQAGTPGEFVRYRPTLEGGRYRVELYGPPFENPVILRQTRRFQVAVSGADGTEVVSVEPTKSLLVGEFAFAAGREGFVEIRSGNGEGLIVVDALSFTKID